ncbi:hypothetical protein [Flavobacterium sp.]|uniref:hypothetical protein n=1 Tax=Flavobacterium sp. TaxID=239 RepID=UPI0037506C4C
MENCILSIEKLLQKLEVYSKTSMELCKYNTIYKSANIISSLVVKSVLGIVFILFFLFLNIGLALLLGEYFGKFYYGFFFMAGFYVLLAFLFMLFQDSLIKNPISNYIIRKTLNKKGNEN